MIAPTYSPEQHRRAKHSKTGMYITRKIFLYSICAIYSIGGTYSLKRQFVRTGVHTSHHILRYDAIGSKIWRSSGERGRRRSWIFSQAKKRDRKSRMSPAFHSSRLVVKTTPPSVLISIRQRWSDLRRRRGARVALSEGPGVLVQQ